jgi:hypothetical protein
VQPIITLNEWRESHSAFFMKYLLFFSVVQIDEKQYLFSEQCRLRLYLIEYLDRGEALISHIFWKAKSIKFYFDKMLKRIILSQKRLDNCPFFLFSQKRRGLKYRYRRQFDKDEPCYYTPLQQDKPNIDDFVQSESKEERSFNRNSLHPHQYWITQGKGTERPFTGDHWDRKDVGHYECVVCTNKLFL